jgi:hypothetical protein
MAVIATYTDLCGEIADWLDRDDLSDKIPGFVSLFEQRFNRLVRAAETTTIWTATNPYPLPSDATRLRVMSNNDDSAPELSQISPAEAARLYQGMTGTPLAYTIESGSLYFHPGGDAPVRVTHFSKLPALGDAMPSNWLLADHSDLYLAGSQFYAASYIDDPDQASRFGAYMDAAIDELNTALRNDKWAGALYPRGPIQTAGGKC